MSTMTMLAHKVSAIARDIYSGAGRRLARCEPWSRASLLLAAGALMYGACSAVADGQTFSRTAPSAAESETSIALERGDKLKVSIYGREDLSAEYSINDEGKLDIPTLGAFDAAGRTAADVRADVLAKIEAVSRRPGFASIDVKERRPVYILGLVNKPGAYAFSPGMAVIHAAALAGGTTESISQTSLQTEALREGSKLRTARADIERLIARRARLEAERDDRAKIALPDELVSAAGQDRADELLRSEQDLLDRQREALHRQQDALKSAIKEGKIEIDAYAAQIANLGEQRRLREQGLDSVKALSVKGLTTTQRMLDSQLLVTSVDRDTQYAIGNMARSRQMVQQSERELAMLTLERNVAIDKELQQVENDLSQQRELVETAKRVIGQVTKLPASMLTRDQEPVYRYEITRKAPNGKLVNLAADELSPLLPGDVIRVTARDIAQNNVLVTDPPLANN